MLVFCITSSNYLKYTTNFLKTLNKHTSSAFNRVFCLGINLQDKEIEDLLKLVDQVPFDIKNVQLNFEKTGFNIADYAVCARAIYLPDIMNHYKEDVLYVDSDINVMSHLDPLVEQVKGADWGIGTRYPSLHPDTGQQLVGPIDPEILKRIDQIHTNAGVIYIKYSIENMKFVEEYKNLVLKTGIMWMVDQNMLNKLMTDNKHLIKMSGMSDEYISKFGTILRHFRGPNKESKYEEYNSILNGISK